MKGGWIECVRVATSAEAEEAVGELLSRVLGQPASVHHDLRSGRRRVMAFLPAGRSVARAQLADMRSGLAALGALGIDASPGRITVRRVRREDWAHSWKRHFPPLVFGDALLVKPAWSRRRPRAGQAVVVVDPGLSFGTGQHATTAFCLGALVQSVHRMARGADSRSMLDIGTGSGILAIAAAKLGFAPVEAFDFDPQAVRIARENVRRNRARRRVSVRRTDLTRLPRRSRRRFDVVCANLTADLLCEEAPRIIARLKPEGWLVLAGVLDSQFAAVRRHYERAGLRLVRSRRQGEWRSGVFAR